MKVEISIFDMVIHCNIQTRKKSQRNFKIRHPFFLLQLLGYGARMANTLAIYTGMQCCNAHIWLNHLF